MDALSNRVARLEERLTGLDEKITEVARSLPRLFAIEAEYQREVVAAELAYVRALIEDLRAERITWPIADGAPVWPG